MDGLDQPSTAGAPAALPGCGRTIRQHAPRVEGVRRTSWGASVRCNLAVEEWVQAPHGMARDAGHAVRACPVCSGHGNVEKACSPIRDNPF